MSYDLSELFEHYPENRSFIEFPHQPGRALFSAHWNDSAFESLAQFMCFCQMFSSVMQGVIEDEPPEEFERWFHPEQDLEKLAQRAFHATRQPESSDPFILLKQELPFASVPGLAEGDFDCTVLIWGEEFPDVYSHGQKGWLYMFVCDLVAH